MTERRGGSRAVWSEVDLEAIRENIRALCALVAPAEVLAVVKANGYGHGAAPVARAALDAGAAWLGVARVEEGVQLRGHGIDAPILLLSEAPVSAAEAVVTHSITPVVYTVPGLEALAKAVAAYGGRHRLSVHLKIDTGMHRVGCDPDDALDLVARIDASPELELAGVCTHLAVADDPADPYTAGQLAQFAGVLDAMRARGAECGLEHAANSAAALACPDARFDLVRIGIAAYGVPPAPTFDHVLALRPALSLHARVMMVRELAAGERLSYGLRYELPHASRIATVSAGYADGVPRNLGLSGGHVLIGGRRHPIAGVVTMDQLMVDVGDTPVDVGDEVVLIGRQGDIEITATEWAELLGTIAYEVVTGIGARVPRTYTG
ncbi:MAG TPA: alanine racemase [Acidimicrobiia bacterium]|nr:alanine racemase [Acidimicrobiia bacterium]